MLLSFVNVLFKVETMWTMMVSHGKQTIHCTERKNIVNNRHMHTHTHIYAIKYPHDIYETIPWICEQFMFSVSVSRVWYIFAHFFLPQFFCLCFVVLLTITYATGINVTTRWSFSRFLPIYCVHFLRNSCIHLYSMVEYKIIMNGFP